MKLQQIRYFCAVCEYNSITLAAESLHMTQPSLSVAIRELESEFGVSLLERVNKGLHPTPEGQRFWQLGNELLEHADQVKHTMQAMKHQKQRFRLGVPVSQGPFVIPPLLSSYREYLPTLELEIVEDGSKALLDKLKKRLLDGAILTNIQPDGFASAFLYQGETQFCVSKKNPLARKHVITYQDLNGFPLVMFQAEGFVIAEDFANRFEKAQSKMNVIYETAQLSNIYHIVGHNLAGTFLDKRLAKSVAETVMIPFSPPITYSSMLFWHQDLKMLDSVKSLVDYMKHI